ncbi:MAG: PAS domain-containing protein [Sphingopyxis sp.]|nr:PAS domain-containing protein [Sphingopyxis sp.]
MPQMVWSTLPDGFHDYYNARWYEFTGVPEGSTDGAGWNGMFHPDDQPRALERWQHSLTTGEPYEIEYRLRHRTGEYRWTIGRANPIRDEDGRITRWIGTCTDIHDAKLATEYSELLSRELSHRIKNIFAVIGGLITLSARRMPEAKQFAGSLARRIAALGRAHDLARPHSVESAPEVGDATLHMLLRQILSPYPAMDKGRIVITGDNLAVDDRGATPLALLYHELATNAVKYGALSDPDGKVQIAIAHEGGQVTLRWTESGGPEIVGVPNRSGFGTALADLALTETLPVKPRNYNVQSRWHARSSMPDIG